MRKLKTSNVRMLLSSYPRIYKNWWFSTGKFSKSQVQRMTNQVKMKDKKGKGEDRKPMNFRKLRNVKTSLIFSKIVFLMMMIRMLKLSKQSLHVHVTLMIFCKLKQNNINKFNNRLRNLLKNQEFYYIGRNYELRISSFS